MDNLRATQEALETQWLTQGSQTYKQRFSEVPFSTTDIGSFIMGKAMSNLEEALEEYFKGVKRWSHDALYAVVHCVPMVELATLTLRYLMDRTYCGHAGFKKASVTSNCISSLSIQLGTSLISHFNWYVFRTKHNRTVSHMEAFLKDKSKLYRRRTIKWYKKYLGHQDIGIPTAEKASLGYPFLRAAIESTGLFEVVDRSLGIRRVSILVPSATVMSNIMPKLEQLSWMHPMHLPMVCPPEPWVNWNTGGYLVLECSAVTHHRETASELQRLGHLDSRLECLNRLQSVPWEIHPVVLEVAQEAYRRNHPIVPKSDLGIQIPPRPWETKSEYQWLKDNRPEIIQEWSQRAAIVMNEFYSNRVIGQRLAFLRTLSIARDFSKYQRIYFPWHMDYRGRFYPIPHTLTPQADDLSRGLLRFHQRTPLTPADPDGWRWFLIQGANLMGIDKVPFDERIQWIRLRHQDIIDSANAPLDNPWWSEADKPWCMLAWCLEYQGLTTGTQDYTQIPVTLDGRCNGLQHLSAAIRDQETADLVSLLPRDKPNDIYTVILKAVEAKVPENSYWYGGKLERAYVKRNVMTTPYNVTREGMKNQIMGEMLARSPLNKLGKEDMLRAIELRNYNYETITSKLGLTAALMGWYNQVAREYSKRNLKLSWVLPDNFRVIQNIPKTKTKKVMLEARTVVINYRVHLDEQEAGRNRSAFSPNVTHSMDATHMAAWLRSLPSDIPVAAIHDSFGLPSPYVNSKGGTIVQTFVDLYESFDVIKAIQDDFRSKTGEELPPPPKRGTLDISKVRESIYAFA